MKLPNIVPLRGKPRLQSLGGGLYQYADRAGYYARPWDRGRQRVIRLLSTTEKKARLELAAMQSQQLAARRGLERSPFLASTGYDVGQVLTYYENADCPQASGLPRRDKGEEVRRCGVLREFWQDRRPQVIRAQDLADYLQWRRRRVKAGQTGERTVDLELTTLSNAIDYAVKNSRVTGVDVNPIKQRQRFRASHKVQHCRDKMPADGEDLHALAGKLLASPRSAAVGWQVLFEAMTGCRTSEILRWRMDAGPKQPGHVEKGRVWLYRSATHKGTAPYVDVHPMLAKCLKAHRAWHAGRKVKSPWYFPGRGGGPLGPGAIAAALRRVSGGIVTSHGLRAYYVSVLRGQGVPDAEIALKIGHKSGGKLIVETYGEFTGQRLGWSAKRVAWSCSGSAEK